MTTIASGYVGGSEPSPSPALGAVATLIINAIEDDKAALSEVVHSLEQLGFVIRTARSSEALADQIEALSAKAIRDFAGILTVWSRSSILDETVVAMAELALQADCLVPLRIEDVEAPIGFRQIQTHDLVRLDREAGLRLGAELRERFDAGQEINRRSEGQTRGFALRIAEWILFVLPTVYAFSSIASALMNGASQYLTFLVASVIVVDTALIGVPAFLSPQRRSAAVEVLTHCTRVDLGLLLALGAATLWVPSVVDSGDLSAVSFVRFVLMLYAAAAAALLLRYLAIGLWLARSELKVRLPNVIAIWILYVVPPILLYTGVLWLELRGFAMSLVFTFAATSSAQTIVAGVPGFGGASTESWSAIKSGTMRLTIFDLTFQSLAGLVNGLFWHDLGGPQSGEAILWLTLPGWIAVLGRQGCIWAWWALRGCR